METNVNTTKSKKQAVATKSSQAKVATKKAVRLVKPTEVKSVVPVKKVQPADPKKPTSLTADVYSPAGKVIGTVELAADLFAVSINEQLIAQAVRVYLANQRQGGAKVKTRGEVEGSTRKIFKQKGTGNARHGSIRAPIFVGGGNAFGPVKRDYSLVMPQKMKAKALASVLTKQFQQGAVTVLKTFDGVTAKTKAYLEVLTTLACTGKTIVLVGSSETGVIRMLRNAPSVQVLRAKDAYTYAILYRKHVVITENGLLELDHIKGN